VESGAFSGISLNYQERRIYHWHEELDRRIGAHRIPPELRVQPVLEPWIKG
jgi:predicted RecB family nuclease